MRSKVNRIYLAIIAALLLQVFGLNAQQDSLDFPAPQYMLPIYDHYTTNYLNVSAMGRGQTTNTLLGKVDNAPNNPATLYSNKDYLYMELTIKPPVNAGGEQLYTSPIPFGMIGISGKIYKSIHGAISYNVPKSLVFDSYIVPINQGGDVVQRYPTYYLHQVTTTVAGNLGDIRLGLNVHQQIHAFEDITVFQTFARIDKSFYAIRLQPGIYYKKGNLGMGATVTTPAKVDFDIDYTTYDITLPLKATAGLAYEFNASTILGEIEWEQFSKMSSKFDDRLTLKAGYEKLVRDITYRAGILSVPGVYTGAYRLPVYYPDNPEQQGWWDAMPRGGVIKDTDQLYGTIGFTYHFKGGELTLGLMRDLLNNVPNTNFAMSIGFNLDTLKGKKFLIID